MPLKLELELRTVVIATIGIQRGTNLSLLGAESERDVLSVSLAPLEIYIFYVTTYMG